MKILKIKVQKQNNAAQMNLENYTKEILWKNKKERMKGKPL
jgi:hypothetical protein